MNSVKKLNELADKFAMKISRGQAQIQEDPKAIVADAFFGPPSSGKSNDDFQKYILQGSSNFLKVLPESVKKCSIGASVNAPGKEAKFLVTTQPAVPKDVLNKITAALNADYTAFYGKDPATRLAARSAAGELRPANVNQSHPEIISVT